MADAFEMWNRGALGSTGAGGGGSAGGAPGKAVQAGGVLLGINFSDTNGLLLDTKGITESKLPGLANIFASSPNAKPGWMDKLRSKMAEDLKNLPKPEIGGGVDVSAPTGGSWAGSVSSSRGGGGIEMG